MYSLLIDTHDASILLALYHSNNLVIKKEIRDSHSHSENTIPALIELLKEKNTSVQELSDIVVVNGPGSFTGERLGVTIAKTLAYTLNIPIRTITSLEMHLNEEIKKNYEYISLPEKNGYYTAKITDKELIDYNYLTKHEYQDFITNNKVIEARDIDLDTLMIYAHQKKALNPHEVNPFYVKKIEVEK